MGLPLKSFPLRRLFSSAVCSKIQIQNGIIIFDPQNEFFNFNCKKKNKQNRTGFLNMLKKCNVVDEKDTYTPIVSKTLDTVCRSEAVTEVTKHTLTR